MSLTWADSDDVAVTTNGVVNTPYTGTFTFLDNDVRALYVDWDDGTSNKKSDANYQWATYTESPISVTLIHTYTASGAFKPVVQTINSRGLASRYYSNESSNADVTPFAQNTAISGVTINDTTATAVMRVENTTVDAGIDNTTFDVYGPSQVYVGIAPTITKAELNTIGKIKLEIDMVVQYNRFVSETADTPVARQTAFGGTTGQITQTVTIDCTDSGAQSGALPILVGNASSYTGLSLSTEKYGTISKIIKVKYVSAYASGSTQANLGTDYTTNEIYNRLKIFLFTHRRGLFEVDQVEMVPVCYVTPGSPIRSVASRNRYSFLDMSQSRTAASNTTISNYRTDNGVLWFNDASAWTLSSNILGTGTKQTTSQLEVSYTYPNRTYGLNNLNQCRLFWNGTTPQSWYVSGTASGSIRQDLIGLDDFGRIYSQYHMVRNSVEASSTSGSIVTTNQPDVFYCKPAPDWSSVSSITATPVTDYSTEMKNNSQASTSSADVNIFKLASTNSQTLKDVGGNTSKLTNVEKDYILLLFDSKTNKIFFNATNYANTLQSDTSGFSDTSGLKIAGVEYLRIDSPNTRTQKAYWKALKFKDTTRIQKEVKDNTDEEYKIKHTSLARSGFISFDMPPDWSSTTLSNLCGGVYNTTASSLAGCTAAGFDDLSLVVSRVSDTSASGYGKNGKYQLDGASATLMTTLGSYEDVGAYKYIFIVTHDGGLTSGAAYWLASGQNNGWKDDDEFYLQVGATGGTNTTNYKLPIGTISGALRRVNVYDVVNGAAKVFSDDGEVSPITDAEICPIGANTYNLGSSYFPNTYNVSNAVFTGSSWSGSAKYALKITLSGATGDGSSSTSPCPELWNIFDANQGDSAIIKVMDDSAYSLNSLAITSSISVGRRGNYFKAITRKGKVYIVKTGIGLEQIGFSSVALGDESSASAFDDHGPSTLYGHLHMIRRLQTETVPVFWDEKQKDGTFVRLWGVLTDVNETRGTGGRRAIVNYTFNMTVKEIALLSNTGQLMTDIFPLGGIPDERTYT